MSAKGFTVWRAKALICLSLLFPYYCSANAELRAVDDFFNLSLSELGQVKISIATGNSITLDKAPATASVIYAAEIAAMGARNLNDVLETVPGLHVSLSSLSRLDAVYSMRGIHTGFNSQVLLLLNGVPVQFSLQGGRPTLLRLPVTSIERVEVIRGPGSAIYGADAFAGVINVITRSPGTTESQLGFGMGSFGERDLWLQAANNQPDWGLSLSMSYQESDGDSSRRINQDFQTFFDGLFDVNASRAPSALATRYKLLDTHVAFTREQLQLNFWSWISRDAGIGAGAAQTLDPEGRDDGNILMFDGSYHLNQPDDVWQNTIRVSHLHYELKTHFNLFPAGSLLPIDQTGNFSPLNPAGIVFFPEGMIANLMGSTDDSQLEYVGLFSGWERHRLRLALGVKRQELDAGERKNYGPGVLDSSVAVANGQLTDVSNTPYVFIPDSQRNLHYLSLQDEWQLTRDLQLTGGLRYDDYSDVGSTSNPRLALVWSATEKLTSKLLYGSAFRPASFSEQYFQNNPVSLGNPDLRPERLESVEWSLNYRSNSHWQTTLTLFDYQAKDMIAFVTNPNSGIATARNALDQDGQGLEWELNWKPDTNWRLGANYSLQDARDSLTGEKIIDAPRQQFMLMGHWEFSPSWSWYGQVNWVGDRPRAKNDASPLGPPRAAVADYMLFDMNLRRKNILPNVDMSIRLRNFTNTDAREPSSGILREDYPLEERSIWLQINTYF